MHVNLALKDIMLKNPDVDFVNEYLEPFIHSMASVSLEVRSIKLKDKTSGLLSNSKYNQLWLGYLLGRGFQFITICDNCKQQMWSYGAFHTALLDEYFICTPSCATKFTLNPDNLLAIRHQLLPYDADSCIKLLCDAIITLDDKGIELLSNSERYRKAVDLYNSIFNVKEKEI